MALDIIYWTEGEKERSRSVTVYKTADVKPELAKLAVSFAEKVLPSFVVVFGFSEESVYLYRSYKFDLTEKKLVEDQDSLTMNRNVAPLW